MAARWFCRIGQRGVRTSAANAGARGKMLLTSPPAWSEQHIIRRLTAIE
ncbi:hypothetical protein SEHO0A_04367 [Salmonella enterica subsp. houtenae str. ATCC BAA-1581]|nr:hypothetical protein SEHO0A_04367 [Salmonella enterica subsp. houtenae str. ATCC BAA-1581]